MNICPRRHYTPDEAKLSCVKFVRKNEFIRSLNGVGFVGSQVILELERGKPSYSACRTVHLCVLRSPLHMQAAIPRLRRLSWSIDSVLRSHCVRNEAHVCEGHVRFLPYTSTSKMGLPCPQDWRDALPGSEHATPSGWLPKATAQKARSRPHPTGCELCLRNQRKRPLTRRQSEPRQGQGAVR